MAWRSGSGRRSACVGVALSAVLLSGCSLRPDTPVPGVELPSSYRNDAVPLETDQAPLAGQPATAQPSAVPLAKPEAAKPEAGEPAPAQPAPAQATPASLPPVSRWWEAYHSAELDRLVERALANNHDLKAAVQRIAQAQALAGISAGALLPTLQLVGQSQLDSPAGGIGTLFPSPNGKSERLHQIGITASYELDFWGKNRFAEEAALATAQSSLYDRETVALTLVANVTTAYIQYLEAGDRIAVAQRNVDNMARVLAMVQKRRNIGEGTDVEIRQQATALAQARAVVPTLVLLREQTRNLLALLVGDLPERLRLQGGSLNDLRIPKVPPSLPSELLTRRPDLRRAQAELVAANANVGQARALLLPSFTINAERGVGSHFLDALFSPASYFYLVAGNLATTLFDNGKLLSQVDYQKAVYGERVEAYRQATLAALRDVENALAAVRLTAVAERAQIDASENARKAYELGESAFRNGLTDYLTILETQRTFYQSDDLRVQARFDRLNAAAALFQGLGGSAAAAGEGGH